uniref:Uncharacterized protein n=1 Tax=Trichuris muris TaxID=70415 RepID=A0A5S6QD11_TRIMR
MGAPRYERRVPTTRRRCGVARNCNRPTKPYWRIFILGIFGEKLKPKRGSTLQMGGFPSSATTAPQSLNVSAPDKCRRRTMRKQCGRPGASQLRTRPAGTREGRQAFTAESSEVSNHVGMSSKVVRERRQATLIDRRRSEAHMSLGNEVERSGHWQTSL